MANLQAQLSRARHYDVYDHKTKKRVLTRAPLEKAAGTAGIDPEEVEWAHEFCYKKRARADTDRHTVTIHRKEERYPGPFDENDAPYRR